MVRFTLMILILSAGLLGYGQSKKVRKIAENISVKDLEERLAFLSSDSLEGRETGEIGQKIAMKYIEDHFASIGLDAPVNGSYIQTFDLEKAWWNEIYFRKDQVRKENLRDFIYYSNRETSGEEFIKLVFAADSADLISMDLDGKFIVMQNESWGQWEGRINELNELNPAGYIIVSMEKKELEFAMMRFSSFFNTPSVKRKFDRGGDQIIITSSDLIGWIFEKPYEQISNGEEASVIFNADRIIQPITGENVMGFLEGSEKPEELIVITSHYDHIGVTSEGLINNGADDDGSGTTAVLELAETFAEAAKKGNRTKRSILFMCVSGEEKGLLGSEYYTDVDPIFPLENTVVNLNMDMIGRVDPKHEGNPDYIHVIGADRLSKELNSLHEEINNNTVKLEFDYTYNDKNDPNRYYYRSDHYHFAKNNIPIIFYFDGGHEDYHKPTDTIEKIDFDRIRKVAQLVFFTAWELTTREERIIVDGM